MTIKELKSIIEQFDDDKDVFVALFKDDHAETFDVIAIRDNNGHLQIDIEEE